MLMKTQPPIEDLPAFENDVPTDEEIERGFYSYADLEARGIVRDRSDLLRKQKMTGFPRPIKTGERQAPFLKSRVHEWVRRRAAASRYYARTIIADQPAE